MARVADVDGAVVVGGFEGVADGDGGADEGFDCARVVSEWNLRWWLGGLGGRG